MCRQDAGNSNLRSAAYEALMDLIKYSAKVGVGGAVGWIYKWGRCGRVGLQVWMC